MSFPATTWTPESLAPRLGGGRASGGPGDGLEEVERILTTAEALLVDACKVTFRTIPAEVADELVLRVARGLWDARKSASGAQYTDNGAPAGPRAPRDPLAAAEALLNRYVVPL